MRMFLFDNYAGFRKVAKQHGLKEISYNDNPDKEYIEAVFGDNAGQLYKLYFGVIKERIQNERGI